MSFESCFYVWYLRNNLRRIRGSSLSRRVHNVCLDGNDYFYPVLEDGKTIVWRSLLEDCSNDTMEKTIVENGENAVPNYVKDPQKSGKLIKRRKLSPQAKKLTDLEKEKLIIEVQHRIPLWNINIPLEDRSKDIKDRLWEEVAAALDGRLNAQEAKIKFKALRDTYRKIVQAKHRTSGSSSVEPDGWKFYKYCEFLRNSCLVRQTNSNVSEKIKEQNEIDDLDPCLEETNRKASGSTAKNLNCTADNVIESTRALNRIADALSKDNNIPITLPEAQKVDTIGAYLTAMGHQIRLLPQRVQLDVIKQFNDIIYEASRRYACDD